MLFSEFQHTSQSLLGETKVALQAVKISTRTAATGAGTPRSGADNAGFLAAAAADDEYPCLDMMMMIVVFYEDGLNA